MPGAWRSPIAFTGADFQGFATHGRGFYVLDDINILRQLTPGVMASAAHLFAPPATELGIDRGVTVDYLLGERASSAALEFVGRDGRVLRRQRVARGAGVHRLVWKSPAGVAGRVGVRLVVDGRTVRSRTARLRRVRRTVRVRGQEVIRPANLAQAQRISPDAIGRSTLGRPGRTRAAAPKARTSQAPDGPVDLLDPADPIRGEDSLGVFYQVREPVESVTVTIRNHQVRLQSGQDPLNFPIRLNNKIAALRGIVESADDRPTDQTYEVFDFLSGQLEEQLVELQGIVSRDVPDFNAALQEAGLQPIACTA